MKDRIIKKIAIKRGLRIRTLYKLLHLAYSDSNPPKDPDLAFIYWH